MSRTLIDQKESFLRTQIRQLTATLSPSEEWREFALEEPEEGHIPDKVVEEVLQKLNTNAKNHHRTVYSSQAIRAVAEQIDTLYLASINSRTAESPEEEGERGSYNHRNGNVDDGTILERGSDLTIPTNIALLPDEWPGDAVDNDGGGRGGGHGMIEEKEKTYRELRQRLIELDEQRSKNRETVARLKHLQSLVAPLKDPKVNVQPNLVTKDGELEKELVRMKMLLARVSWRMPELDQQYPLGHNSDTGNDGSSIQTTESEKLKALLDGPG